MGISRETILSIEGKSFSLNKYYLSLLEISKPKVKYNNFRQCVKSMEKRELLSWDIISEAFTMDNAEWISSYGGGKHKPFTYTGTKYPEYSGITFRSLSKFCRKINKYDMYNLIKVRLLNKWDIDSAVIEPPKDYDSIGSIYILKSDNTNLQYIGQTTKPIDMRFEEHKQSFNENRTHISTLLHNAFNKYGIDSFRIELLENYISMDKSTERENFWMKEYNTLCPNGLNMIKGQNSAHGQGKKIEYLGIEYPSIATAVRILHKEHPEIPDYTIEKCIRDNKILPTRVRIQSKHIDAGSAYQRRWNSQKNKGNLCEEWRNGDDGYEQFKIDMGKPPNDEYKLFKKNQSLPHSKENSEWISLQASIERISGKSISIHEKVFPTHTAVAKKYEIPLSTLNYRLAHGETPEQAIMPRKNSTKKQTIIIEDKVFSSKDECFKYMSSKYSITYWAS